MMKASNITEEEHKKFFDQAVSEMAALSLNCAESIIADSVAVNRQLAGFLLESRKVVEDEAILVIDAMCLAFDGKSEKLKALKAATEQVSAESAFMKTALNTISTKAVEIERLTGCIDALSDSLLRFKQLVDDGTLERAAKAASSITA